jgi:hypothetical protein
MCAWFSCGCQETRPNKAENGDGDSEKLGQRRWWRNFCEPSNDRMSHSLSEEDDHSESTDRDSKTVLRRHIREFGDEPGLCMYSIMDFPGVGSHAKASPSNGTSRKARACRLPPNTEKGVPIKTENFEGHFFCMNKRDPAYGNPEDRYYRHFHKRRRLWEMRVQGRFRRRPEGDMFIGIVLRDFNYNQAVESSSVVVKKMACALVRYDLYMHWGDRCEASRLPDAELSHMVTNMTGWDQIIVSPAGEEPPAINGNLAGLGLERKEEGLKEYGKACEKVFQEIDLESTYTMSFYGVSQLLDVLHWQFIFAQMGIGARMPISRFFQEWPIHACMYELDRKQLSKDDKRHLESRKRYYLDICVWSNQIPEVADNPVMTQTYQFMDSPKTLAELPDSNSNHDSPRRSRLGSFFGRKAASSSSSASRLNGHTAHGRSRASSDDEDSFYSCSSGEGTPRGSGPGKPWYAFWRSNNGTCHYEEDKAYRALIESRRARLINDT